MGNSVIYNSDDKERLYTDLFHLTYRFAPERVTLEMVKTVLFRLASKNGYDRAALALKLYWTLSSDYYTMSPTSQYIEMIEEMSKAVPVLEERIR